MFAERPCFEALLAVMPAGVKPRCFTRQQQHPLSSSIPIRASCTRLLCPARIPCHGRGRRGRPEPNEVSPNKASLAWVTCPYCASKYCIAHLPEKRMSSSASPPPSSASRSTLGKSEGESEGEGCKSTCECAIQVGTVCSMGVRSREAVGRSGPE